MSKLIDNLLKNTQKSLEGSLKTNLGTKKESIYKEEIFTGCTDKEKKIARRKFRKIVRSIFESIIISNNAKDTKNVSKLAKSFADFYKETYKVNDYSFSSIASENTKDKDTINNALAIIKKELKIK